MTTKTMDRKGETGRNKRNDQEGNKGVWTLKSVRSVVRRREGRIMLLEGRRTERSAYAEREREDGRLVG